MRLPIVATMIVVLVSALPIAPAAAPTRVATFPCSDASKSTEKVLAVGQTALLAFPHAPNPLRVSAQTQSGAATVASSEIVLAPKQSVVVDGHVYENRSNANATVRIAYTPKTLSTAPPDTSPSPWPVDPPFNSDDRVLSVAESPLPLPSASPGSAPTLANEATFVFPATALAAGTSEVLIGNGQHSCSYLVHVAAGPPKATVLFTTGVGGSALSMHSITGVAASPLPGASPGQYVYYTERSEGQTFVPVLASYRITDRFNPFQFYVTGGLPASSSQG